MELLERPETANGQNLQKRSKERKTHKASPRETKQTYYDGVKFLLDNHIQPGTYTLMMLCGAELGKDAAIEKYKMKGKWRILPKQFGRYNGNKATNCANLNSNGVGGISGLSRRRFKGPGLNMSR